MRVSGDTVQLYKRHGATSPHELTAALHHHIHALFASFPMPSPTHGLSLADRGGALDMSSGWWPLASLNQRRNHSGAESG
jgi:hypothetical protein